MTASWPAHTRQANDRMAGRRDRSPPLGERGPRCRRLECRSRPATRTPRHGLPRSRRRARVSVREASRTGSEACRTSRLRTTRPGITFLTPGSTSTFPTVATAHLARGRPPPRRSQIRLLRRCNRVAAPSAPCRVDRFAGEHDSPSRCPAIAGVTTPSGTPSPSAPDPARCGPRSNRSDRPARGRRADHLGRRQRRALLRPTSRR